MREIRVWKVDVNEDDLPTVNLLDTVEQTKTEALLEEIIVCCPELLFKDLKLVGRQTDTTGGVLDLLGVDSDGQLIVFYSKWKTCQCTFGRPRKHFALVIES